MPKNYRIMWVDVDFANICEEMKQKGEVRSLREGSKKIADGLRGLQLKRKSKKIVEDDWETFMPF
jgi:hypothetical protein